MTTKLSDALRSKFPSGKALLQRLGFDQAESEALLQQTRREIGANNGQRVVREDRDAVLHHPSVAEAKARFGDAGAAEREEQRRSALQTARRAEHDDGEVLFDRKISADDIEKLQKFLAERLDRADVVTALGMLPAALAEDDEAGEGGISERDHEELRRRDQVRPPVLDDAPGRPGAATGLPHNALGGNLGGRLAPRGRLAGDAAARLDRKFGLEMARIEVGDKGGRPSRLGTDSTLRRNVERIQIADPGGRPYVRRSAAKVGHSRSQLERLHKLVPGLARFS